MFGGYESVDEQEYQWMQQERNDNGDFQKQLKVPNRMMKVHVSTFIFPRIVFLKILLISSRWMVVMANEILLSQSHTALGVTVDQTIRL